MIRTFVASLLLSASLVAVSKTTLLEHIPLEWRPTSNLRLGTVAIHLTVIGQDGKTLWNGLASGEATRLGRSYKAENYYEVLSDAVVNTVSSMLQAADFQKAISGHAADES